MVGKTLITFSFIGHMDGLWCALKSKLYYS